MIASPGCVVQRRHENISKEVFENTYLRNLEIPQILLFDILANRFPLVIEAQNIIGRALVESVKEKTHITLACTINLDQIAKSDYSELVCLPIGMITKIELIREK